MSRTEQLEKLAKVWCDMDEGQNVFLNQGVVALETVCWSFMNSTLAVPLAVFRLDATDTDDATPCLALLRDVKGETWDVMHGEGWWQCHDSNRFAEFYDGDDGTWNGFAYSELSRIDALTKALEAK